MATASQAIEQIAEAIGLLPATVFRAARWLREADTSMWPQGTQGRGKAAHVEPRHLVNVILALGVAEPITSAPEVVPEWHAMPARGSIGWMMGEHPTANRLLRGCCFGEASIALDEYRDAQFTTALPKEPDKDGGWSGKGDPRCYQVLPGETLGDALERLIDHLAGHDRYERLRLALRSVDWRLFLSSNQVARVAYRENGLTFSSHFHRPEAGIGLPAYVKSASFGFQVIEALADLWDDTLRHRASTPLSTILAQGRRELRKEAKRVQEAAAIEAGHTREIIKSQPFSLLDAPNSAIPENETAAFVPGKGRVAAAVSDQPREDPELGDAPQPHLTGEREKSQSPSDSAAGHSPQQWSDPDDEPGDGGAYCAAA